MDSHSEGGRFVSVLENLWFPDEGLVASLKPLNYSGSDTSPGASPQSQGSQATEPDSSIETPHTPNPRKPSNASKRIRSCFACSFCRGRKIRCDATIYGRPCTNCRRYDYDCFLEPLSKFKSHKIAHRKNLQGYTFIHMAQPHPPSEKRDDNHCSPDLISPFAFPPPHAGNEKDQEGLDEDAIYNTIDSKHRIQLLAHFLQFVYWQLPVLSLRNLHDMISRERRGAKPANLLLFQAILFAAASRTRIAIVLTMGYHSREDAMEALLDPVKKLYKVSNETNPITTIQAVLLLAHGCDAEISSQSKSEKSKGNYWMDIAVSLCHQIGLHKYSALQRSKPFSSSAQRTWRRVWWACFVCESELAQREKRAPRFKQGDWDVPMLNVGDFEADGLLDLTPQGSGAMSAEACVEIAQLYADQAAASDLFTAGLSSGSESSGIDIENDIICQMNGTVGADINLP